MMMLVKLVKLLNIITHDKYISCLECLSIVLLSCFYGFNIHLNEVNKSQYYFRKLNCRVMQG